MLGVWLEAGHQHWFANAGHQEAEQRVRAQIYPRFFASHVTLYCSHVIHLYMNGDLCDVTKVARVKFRCALYRIQWNLQIEQIFSPLLLFSEVKNETENGGCPFLGGSTVLRHLAEKSVKEWLLDENSMPVYQAVRLQQAHRHWEGESPQSPPPPEFSSPF